MTRLNETQELLTISDFEWASRYLNRDNSGELLLGLSVLELGLVASMKRLHEQSVLQCTFEQVFREYDRFSSNHLQEVNSTRAVCFKAFERLLEMGLIRFVDNRVQSTPKEFRMAKLMVFPYQVNQTLEEHSECPIALQKWGT